VKAPAAKELDRRPTPPAGGGPRAEHCVSLQRAIKQLDLRWSGCKMRSYCRVLPEGKQPHGNQGLPERPIGRTAEKMGEQRTRDFGHQARLVAIIVALGVLALFTALNFDEVEVDMLVAKQDIRLGFALIFLRSSVFLSVTSPQGRNNLPPPAVISYQQP
jgi:uncharacterized integral membrane protein